MVPQGPGGIFQQMVQPQGSPTPSAPTPAYTPQQAQEWMQDPRGIFELIQRETRTPLLANELGMFERNPNSPMPMANSNFGANGVLSEMGKAMMEKYGMKAHWQDPYQSEPMGEGATIDNVPGSWIIDDYGSFKPENLPKTVFGHDFRRLSEKDKYLVYDPRAVKWDDNYGWITHQKNYNSDLNDSWLEKSLPTLLPSLMAMAVGLPPIFSSLMGGGLGAVRTLGSGGNLLNLLPSIVGAGLGLGGISGLPALAARMGTGFFTNMLTNRGGRG